MATWFHQVDRNVATEVARLLLARLPEESTADKRVRDGVQQYLELRSERRPSDDLRWIARWQLHECGETNEREAARRLLCARRVREATSLAGQAGDKRITPREEEWAIVPERCRERLGSTVSCEFPSVANDGLDAFRCRNDEDCVAVKSGCGIRAIVGHSPYVHHRHRCQCRQGLSVRGCFPVGAVSPSSGTANGD